MFEMYDEPVVDDGFDGITKGEYDDMHEDLSINDVLNRFVRLCQEYGFYFMMRQLTKALNAKGFNV